MSTATPTTGNPSYIPSQDERTLACIAHLTILVSTIGWLIAIGIWIYTRSSQPYAAFQAAQAVVYQFVVMVVGAAVGIVVLFTMAGVMGFGAVAAGDIGTGAFGVVAAAMVFGVLGILALASLLLLAYAIYAAVRAYRGEPFRIPGIGAIAEALQPMPAADHQHQTPVQTPSTS
jgi:uncharacterized Tic20 family protein